jgi:transposase InsO family protein
VIQNLAAEFGVKHLCWVLEVSRSAYYHWLHRAPGPRAQANQQLLEHIQRVHQEHRQAYGSPRITRQLAKEHLPCGENRVARLMQAHHLRAKRKRPFRPRTTQSRHGEPVAPNRLRQEPAPTRPDQVWVADITYLWTLTGWVYLAAVMDLYSRRIVGWALSDSLEASLVKRALQQALVVRRPAPGLLHHSDRGVQYTSSALQALLHSWQVLPSMSAKGNCYDNAAMEAFWSTLKTELDQQTPFTDGDQARLRVFDYIETFYNRKRLHSALGFQSPVEFEEQLAYKRN